MSKINQLLYLCYTKELKKAKRKQKTINKRKKKEANERFNKNVKRTKFLTYRNRIAEGDTLGKFTIIITQNYKEKKRIRTSRWRSKALIKYNKIVEENNNNVKFNSDFYNNLEKGLSDTKKYGEKINEILLVEIVDQKGEISTHLRGENGLIEENIIVNADSFKIIKKNVWKEEETFHVYGFHPVKDRKDFNFILNELLLKKKPTFGFNQVMIYNNYVIFRYDDDIDIISCKCHKQACDLHNALSNTVGETSSIIFSGVAKNEMTDWLLDLMEQKTGRNKRVFKLPAKPFNKNL